MGWGWLVQNSPLIAGIIDSRIMPQCSPQKVEEACVGLQAANCNGSLPAWPCKPLHTVVPAAGNQGCLHMPVLNLRVLDGCMPGCLIITEGATV